MDKFSLNRSGVRALLKSDDVRKVCTDKAQRVLSAARASAPVDSGAYQRSIHIEQATTDRAAVRVVASVPYARAVEARTGNLARALSAV